MYSPRKRLSAQNDRDAAPRTILPHDNGNPAPLPVRATDPDPSAMARLRRAIANWVNEGGAGGEVGR
jgi:hypothetical protein